MNTGRILKPTLSIDEVARRTGLSVSDLPLYEDKELIVSTRTSGNQRRCTRDSIRRVSFIRAAQRVGLSLKENRAALDDLAAGRTPTREDWEGLAWRWKPLLDECITALERSRDQHLDPPESRVKDLDGRTVRPECLAMAFMSSD